MLKTTSAVISLDGTPTFPPGKATLPVQAGDDLRFSCTGFIDEGDHNLGSIQADGDGRAPDHKLVDDGAADDKYPLAGSVRYALGGGILDPSGKPIARFLVGRAKRMQAPKTGSLVLFANDDKPSDNKRVSDPKIQTPWNISVDVIHDDGILPPPNTPGLEIADIDIVQVTQDAAGDSIMVGSKSTAVRAYLTVPDPSRLPKGTAITGTVNVFAVPPDAGAGFSVGKFPALNGATVQVVTKGKTIDRSQTDASLNFEIPGSVLTVNTDISHFRFEVTASVPQLPGGPLPGGPATGQRTAGFVRPGGTLSLNVVYVYTPVNGSPPLGPNVANLHYPNVAERLPVQDSWAANAMLPGSPIQPTSPSIVTLDVDVGGNGSKYGDILSAVNSLVLTGLLVVANPGAPLMSLVPANPAPSGPLVAGIQGGTNLAVGTYLDADENAAHEINHTLGIMHAASPGCVTPSDIDATLPAASDAPGWSFSGAPLVSGAFGIAAHTVVANQTSALMGYCPVKWPTAAEYDRGYRRLSS